jgi:hypothetical protein
METNVLDKHNVSILSPEDGDTFQKNNTDILVKISSKVMIMKICRFSF